MSDTENEYEEECEMCCAKGELHFANTMHWCEKCLRNWIDERIRIESKTKDEDMYDHLVGDGCEYVVDAWFANEINSVKVISEWWLEQRKELIRPDFININMTEHQLRQSL
jgi:hypothetical protein